VRELNAKRGGRQWHTWGNVLLNASGKKAMKNAEPRMQNAK
jgi:hypothetical protein